MCLWLWESSALQFSGLNMFENKHHTIQQHVVEHNHAIENTRTTHQQPPKQLSRKPHAFRESPLVGVVHAGRSISESEAKLHWQEHWSKAVTLLLSCASSCKTRAPPSLPLGRRCSASLPLRRRCRSKIG